MNDLNRMRKLAGMLTESVAIVPGIGNQESNMQTASTVGNDNADASFDASQPQVNETDDSNIVAQKLERLAQMSAGMVDREEALVAISRELSDEGYDNDDIASIMGEIEIQLHNDHDREEFLGSEDEDNNTCVSCNGSGEGQYDGTRCSSCGGSGVDRNEQDSDDADPPDDEPDDYMGPFEEAVMDESFDLQNGYNDEHDAHGADYFPNGADSSVTSSTGAAGARQGDNPEQKKMAVAETHRELVYNYRNFLKESAKK